MNKLDEILAEFEDDIYTFLSAKQAIYNIDLVKSRKKAKQAIIELIEGEIREELEEVSPHDENNDHVKDMIAYSNGSLKILILKLAKLKE